MLSASFQRLLETGQRRTDGSRATFTNPRLFMRDTVLISGVLRSRPRGGYPVPDRPLKIPAGDL